MYRLRDKALDKLVKVIAGHKKALPWRGPNTPDALAGDSPERTLVCALILMHSIFFRHGRIDHVQLYNVISPPTHHIKIAFGAGKGRGVCTPIKYSPFPMIRLRYMIPFECELVITSLPLSLSLSLSFRFQNDPLLTCCLQTPDRARLRDFGCIVTLVDEYKVGCS